MTEKPNKENEPTAFSEDRVEYQGREVLERKAVKTSVLNSVEKVILLEKFARDFKPEKKRKIAATKVRESMKRMKRHYMIGQQKPVLSYENDAGFKMQAVGISVFYQRKHLGCKITLKINQNCLLPASQQSK